MSALGLWPLARTQEVSVGSLFEAAAGQEHDREQDRPARHDLASDQDELRVAIFNAKSCGISHVTTPGVSDVPSLDKWTPGVLAIRKLRDGRSALDVAVVADLASDLHPPGPNCFETYEIVGVPELLTPDFSAPSGDPGSRIIAMFGFIDDADVQSLRRQADVALRIQCAGSTEPRTVVDYALRWWTP